MTVARRFLAPLLLGLFLLPAAALAESSEVDYLRDIRPIFAQHCFRCHGNGQQKSGLRLDRSSSLLEPREQGPLITPGASETSRLIQLVTGHESPRMPADGEPLSDAEIELLTRWVDAGARLPTPDEERHWAFRPVHRPELPAVNRTAWVRNEIDRFIAADHDRRGLTPAPEAPRHVLLRRVYLDLVGLPPTPEQLLAFEADTSPDAYEQIVDQLLDSPQYGERWGRHWMDVWRYSDWSGYGQEVRTSQPHIWRWRDWIVESLNRDKGYDRMILEMLAGDELAPTDPDVLRATGYLVRNWYKFNRNTWLENTIDHTTKGFLGLTVGCAKCHDHMYDPLTQVEYYQIRAFFEPYDVRTDRVPGQLHTEKDGLPRVFDQHLQTPTYLFTRGDERQPDESRTFAPALPELFEKPLEIQPVELPVTAYYPALRPTVQRDLLEAARAKVQAAEATLAQLAAERSVESPDESSESATAGAERAPGDEQHQVARRAAEAGLQAARDELVSLEARLAAERWQYLKESPEDPSVPTESLPSRAIEAERRATLSRLAQDVATAELQVFTARQELAAKPDDESKKKALDESLQKLETAKKSLADAEAQTPPETYSPLGEIYPAQSSGRRLALARWIASRDNPLTARVAVNQLWMRHFGQPLVETVFEFGQNGQPPRQPELLDWLAAELMDQDWSMKHLHRLMVTSSTYRMLSAVSDPGENQRIDPDNHWLWRMNSRRLEAEIVRDSVLAVAGQLDETMGGPELDQGLGQTTHRRSLYYRHAYERQMQFLQLFDAANPEECYRRPVSVIPQQALALANSPLSLAQSRRLATQLSAEVASAPEAEQVERFIEAAYLRVLTRRPSGEERQLCRQFLVEQTGRLMQPEQLTPFTSGPDVEPGPAADPQQRARESLVHVLMNHNDFITLR